MSFLFFDGFDAFDFTGLFAKWDGVRSGGPASDAFPTDNNSISPLGRSGGQCLCWNQNVDAAFSGPFETFEPGLGFIVGCAVNPRRYTADPFAADLEFLTLTNNNGTEFAGITISAKGILGAWIGGAPLGTAVASVRRRRARVFPWRT